MRRLPIIGSADRNKRRWSCRFFDRWTATRLQSLHQASYANNLKTKFTCCFNGLDRRASSGADVVNDYHMCAFFMKTFHAASHAVGLLCLAHQKTMNRATC